MGVLQVGASKAARAVALQVQSLTPCYGDFF